MARRPVAHVTDTYFAVYDFDAFLELDMPGWRAINDWCKRHGLDPADVASSGPIHRDVEHCRIVYVGRTDEYPGNAWTTCVQQGETPPLPWPPELDKYRMPQGAWT